MFGRLGRLCAGTCAPFAGSAQVDTRRRPQEQDRARSPEAAVAEGPRDRTSSLVNAVLCYTLLEVLQRLGLPLLAFGRFWALLACVLFWLWHSIEPSRPPKKWNPRAEAANNEPVEVFLETLARELDERKPPLDPAALRAASWQDISTKGAEVFIKFVKEPKMTTQVCLNIESHDQEPDFPWIVVENDKLAGGAVPIFLALELWPAWFPFCQKVEKLANLGTNQGIYLLRYKIAFLTVDIVLLAALVDNLSSNGRLELLFASPPKGAKSWMGTTVPGRTASFRYVIPGMRLSIRPSTTRSGNIVLQAETLDEVQIQWAVKLFWQACASRIIGLLSRMQRRYEGSTLQAHYAVETKDVQDQRRHFFKLEERIAQSCAR